MATDINENIDTNNGENCDLSPRVNDKDTDWKRRTVELEEELYLLRERVNSQTGRIREAVSKRLKIAEDNAKQAEERAENLLKKMKELEERTLFAESKVTRCYERNQHLEDIIEQKESIIRQLRTTVSEQSKNEIDGRLFEEKVAKVKDWVKQCKLTMEDLQLQIQEKEDMIERMKNGFPQHIGVHISRVDGDANGPKISRARSKSAVTLSRGVVKVSEIVPAVPPRRASLGVLNRSNSNLKKNPGKCGLQTFPENSNTTSSKIDKFKLNVQDNDAMNKKLSGSEENFEDRTYMVLESEPHQEYSSPNKSKFYVSAEKDDANKPAVRMTMRERLKQLTQSSEDEIDHTTSDSDLSPAVDKHKKELVNELMSSLEAEEQEEDSTQSNVGQQVVTVMFSADQNGMLSAEGAKVTTTGKLPEAAGKESSNEDNEELTGTQKDKKAEDVRFQMKPGKDAQGYTKLLPVNEPDNDRYAKTGADNSASSFKSSPKPNLPKNDAESESGSSSGVSTSTPPMRRSWMQDHKVLNPVVNGVIASEEWRSGSEIDIINGTQDGFSGNLTQIQSCPVYAQLEGRASEIQNRPCTGDSTDSSDNETDSGLESSDSLNVSRAKSVSVSDRLLRRGSARRKVLKTCAQYTTQNLKSESLQKTGYLSKLGGRIKNWKRRWFVLSENKLSYYKTENDVNKKALGQIPLEGFCGITRIEGSLSFQIDTPKRKYYLTGESIDDIDDWLKVLQNDLRKFPANHLLAQVNEKPVMKGWITKVKLGKSKRVYCILRGKSLCYYKGEMDQAPFALENMKEFHIEKIMGSDSEDDLEPAENEQRNGRFTLRLYKEKQPTTSSVYLVIETKQDLNAWLYHLTMASGHINQIGTDFEKTIAQLKQDGDPESPLWNSTIITHSKEPLENPLTTLPSEELEEKAVQLFKSIQLFCDTECVPGPALDYHVVYAQNALQMCLSHTELREEMYCQLMKQTAKRVHVLSESASALERFLAPHSEWLSASRSNSVVSNATIDLRPIREYVYEQCWQLLILCCTLFIPRGHVLWFLKAHLEKYSTKETIIGKYARYCKQCLQRTLENGEREAGPSRMEVIAVLLDDPFEKKHPLKIPVHFVNRTSEEFGFDAATTVQELIDAINSEIGLRSIDQSGYALYTDNPVGPVQHCLQTSVKVCDVISKWEKTMQSLHQGRHETNRVIRLSYKNRLYFKSLSKNETPTERYFLVYQTFNDTVNGRFPISKDRCIRMTALMAQMEFGDRVAQGNQGDDTISMIQERFYPRKIKEPMTSEQRRQLRNRFLDAWQSLMGKTKQECITLYLCMAKNWPTFGAKLFKAKQRRIVSRKRDSASENLEDVWLAVQEECISILDSTKMNPVFKYNYRSVVTFGGWKEDFMLVVNKTTPKRSGQSELGTERLLFVMPRGKILEITLLIASYINAIVRQQGLTFDVTSTTKVASATAEKDIKVWDMESTEWPMVSGPGLI
ncbi:pleckstrin homology domain-containing family H member 2-like [Dendronephthya gigantea]|uniref:pleckstrin homology domain-containing family H member 2-like n=1 Tax=Dendronephthya gigantea TaxID=151771 RepID=UPI00106931C3|nr:pleckstrin homology domain-containing family H member 2-like [Dendronephthya gigantea]